MIDINKIARDILINERCRFVRVEDEVYDVYESDKIRIKKAENKILNVFFPQEDNIYAWDRNSATVKKSEETDYKGIIFRYDLGKIYAIRLVLREKNDNNYIHMTISHHLCNFFGLNLELLYEKNDAYIMLKTINRTKEEARRINLSECNTESIINMLYEMIISEINDETCLMKFNSLFTITKPALIESINDLIYSWINVIPVEMLVKQEK